MAKPSRKFYSSGQREVWVHPLRQLPELAMFGVDSFRKVKGLGSHSHSCLEICFIEKGTVTWWMGSERHEIPGGHATFVWPGEIHGGLDGVLHPCKLFWLLVDAPGRYRPGWLGLLQPEGRALLRAIGGMRRVRILSAPQLCTSFHRLQAALRSTTPQARPLALARVRSALVALLLEVTSLQETPATSPWPQPVRAAIALMDQHLVDSLPVPELARQVGLSTSHFKRIFRLATGVPPADYYLRRRVGLALERIRSSSRAITEIALDLGFSSSQYFADCCRRITGRTPSSYRRKPEGEGP